MGLTGYRIEPIQDTIKDQDRQAQAAMLITGLLVAASGLVVLIGYFLKIQVLVAPAFGVDMQPNCGIAFVLLGAGLCAHALRRRMLVMACAIPTLLIALLSFVQYVFDVNLGIDLAIEIPGMPSATVYPGRVFPDAAVGLFCAACALISFNIPASALPVTGALRWLGIVPLVGSLVALAYYFLLGTASEQEISQHMPPNTAAVLLLLAAALVRQAQVLSRRSVASPYTPSLVAAFSVGALASFLMWGSLHHEQIARLKTQLQEEATQLSGLVVRDVERQLLAVERLAVAWELADNPMTDLQRQLDARSLVRDRSGLDALAYLDVAGRVQWLEVEQGIRLQANDPLFNAPELLADLQRVRSSGAPERLWQLDGDNGASFIVMNFPLGQGNEVEAFLMALMDVTNLLDTIFLAVDSSAFSVRVEERQSPIYTTRSQPSDVVAATARADIVLPGALWQLAISPSVEFAQETRSSVAEMFLALGLGVSLLLSWSVSQQAQLRTASGNLLDVNKSLRGEIATREQIQVELRSKEQYNRLLLDSAGAGIYGIDVNGNCTFCNAAFLRMLGFDNEQQLLGRNMHSIIHHSHGDGRPYSSDDCRIYQAFRKGVDVHVDNEVFWKASGDSIPVEYRSHPMIQDGQVVGCVVNFIDLSERQADRQAMLHSEIRFQETFRQAAVGIAHVGLDSRFIRINQRFCDIVGYSEQEMLALSFQDITHEGDLNSNLDNLQSLMQGRIDSYNTEKRYIRKSGEQVWVKLTVSMVASPQGAPDYFISVVEDITARRTAELALQASEERFELASRGTNDGLWDWNILTSEVWYAPRFKQLLGYADDEFPHQFSTFAEHLHPDDYDRTMEFLRLHLEERQPYDVEYRLRTRSGEHRWFLARGESLRDDSGNPVRMAGSIQDITDRHEMLETLRRTNQDLQRKSQEVEAFVYIVSHDLRAPLVNIQGFCHELTGSCRELENVLEKAEIPPALQRDIRRIVSEDIPGSVHFITAGTGRFERLIDALLRLSRTGRQEYRPVLVDLNRTSQGIIASLHMLIESRRAQVSVDNLPVVLADPTAIEQVFANLLGNALNYLDPERPGRISVGGKLEDRHYHFWVTDNGLGLPPGTEDRLFRVFQRLHPARAEGEGMGLAIVKRIIERHDGEIWADSIEGEGTTFHFTIPAHDQIDTQTTRIPQEA